MIGKPVVSSNQAAGLASDAPVGPDRSRGRRGPVVPAGVNRMIGRDVNDAMTGWRRDFHAHPELGFDEHRTSARVAELLQGFGLDVVTGVGGTGVVGILQRGNGTRTIGLRADMDALPIHERTSFAHKSTRDGVMHACGHDGHTAMLLGAARQLPKAGNSPGGSCLSFNRQRSTARARLR